MSQLPLIVRQAQLTDLHEMQRLFVETIEAVCPRDYSPEQITVWTSSIDNKERWINKLTNQYVLLAVVDEMIAGFASLEGDHYLDLLYVHKDFQRQGIADHLFQELLKEAKRRGTTRLESDVSITARPFFEKKGFETVKENRNVIKGVEIVNYHMKRLV